MLNDRSKLIPKLLFMLQLIFISLKLDGKIGSGWIEVFFGFLLMLLVGVVVALSLAIFLVINIFFFKEQASTIKSQGIIFIIINSLAVTITASLPVLQILLNVRVLFTGGLGIIFNVGCLFLLWKKASLIILFLC